MQLLLKNHFTGVTNKLFFIYLFIYLLFEWSLYRMSRDVSCMNSAPFTHTPKSDLYIDINTAVGVYDKINVWHPQSRVFAPFEYVQ